jgi:hypothetical protein
MLPSALHSLTIFLVFFSIERSSRGWLLHVVVRRSIFTSVHALRWIAGDAPKATESGVAHGSQGCFQDLNVQNQV